MGTIIVSQNVTLDGVTQDPTGEEGLAGGGWFGRVSDADRAGFAEVLTAEALGARALLFGGRSYAWFATRWATRTGPWADRLRELPKHVVTSSFEDLGWGPAAALTGDVVDDVAKLRDAVDGEVVVYASGRLVPVLLEHGLVDELRLLVYPVVLGAGDRLFRGTPASLSRSGARPVGDGLVLLTYRAGRAAG